MIVEKVALSVNAIDEEIEICKNIINQFQEELDELTEKTTSLTERIKVMQAIDEKLPEGGTKSINEGNIKLAVDERFELVPEIRKKTNTIKHYEKIHECLIELKKEYLEKE